MVIEDFGQKIGGARKDLAAGNLVITDLDDMNDKERQNYVQKKYIWKSENAIKTVHDGKDRALAYWQNIIWKSIPTKPEANWYVSGEKAERAYVTIVTDIRDKVMSSDTPGYVTDNGHEIKLHEYLVNMYAKNPLKRGYYLELKDEAYVVITNKLLKVSNMSRFDAEAGALKNRYGMTDDEKIKYTASLMYVMAEYTELPPAFGQCSSETVYGDDTRICIGRKLNNGKYFYYGTAEIGQHLKEGVFLVLNQSDRSIMSVKESKEDAEKEISSLQDKFIALCTSNTGSTKTSKKGKKRFPRQLLSVKQENGSIIPADKEMITGEDYLTTFAFRGGEFGNWMNDNDRIESMKMGYISFLNLAKVLGITPKDISFGGKMSIAFGSRGRGHAAAHYEPARDVINLTKPSGAGCLAHEYGHALDHYLGSLTGQEFVTKSVITKAPLFVIPVLNAITHAQTFNLHSKLFDEHYSKESNGYWSSKCEMFARAFDCFIKDSLEEKGITDTYLTSGADSFWYEDNEKNIIRAYPYGEERKTINAAFRKMLQDMKEIK